MTFQAYEESTFNGSPLELYRFTVDLRSYTYTNGVTPVTIGNTVYAPLPIGRGEVTQNASEAPGLMNVNVPQDAPIAALFGPFLPASPVGLTVMRRHLNDPDAQFVPTFIGTIATHVFEGDRLSLSAYSLLASLKRRTPWLTYQRTCNWALYSAGCGVNPTNYRIVGTVLTVSGLSIAAAAFSGQANDWLRSGWIERAATGETRFITSHVGTAITVQSPFPDLSIGESVVAYAGCDRTMPTCQSKFANLDRHAGWPDVPSKNPYRDNVYGNGVSSSRSTSGGSVPAPANGLYGWRG